MWGEGIPRCLRQGRSEERLEGFPHFPRDLGIAELSPARLVRVVVFG